VNVYLDASVLVREILEQRPRLREFDEIIMGVTSQIARVECFRVLDRIRLTERRTDEHMAGARRNTVGLFERLNVMPLDSTVLSRASEPMPTVLKTLDAIHLITAQLYRATQPADEPPIYFATFDLALAKAAHATGFRVLGATL
jgi:predicted nucleic acid-binding protein